MAKAIIFQHCGFKTCWEITYWKVTLWRFLSPLCPLFRSINRCPWKLRKLSLNIGFAWFQFDVFIKITCSKNWRRVFCLFFDHSAHWLKNEIWTCLDPLCPFNCFLFFLKNPDFWSFVLLFGMASFWIQGNWQSIKVACLWPKQVVLCWDFICQQISFMNSNF